MQRGDCFPRHIGVAMMVKGRDNVEDCVAARNHDPKIWYCERSEAILRHLSTPNGRHREWNEATLPHRTAVIASAAKRYSMLLDDCFASLAMTIKGRDNGEDCVAALAICLGEPGIASEAIPILKEPKCQ